LQLIEAVVLPMTHKDRFQALGIQPPKGMHYAGLSDIALGFFSDAVGDFSWPKNLARQSCSQRV